MMLTAGIDMGAKNIKAVILEDGKKVKGKGMERAGFDAKASAQKALDEALRNAGVKLADLAYIVATGVGRADAPHAKESITEVTGDSRGAGFIHPSVRTVIAVGAEEGRGIRCDASHKVVDFAVNEKCAAGAGAFTEAMARALEVPVEQIGHLAVKSKNAVPMNAQCAVFAESEVVSLVHAKTPKEDIARAVHDAIGDRIVSMVRKVGFEKDVMVIGGVALNPGFIAAIKRGLEMDVVVPEDPLFVGALGAALYAAAKASGGA